jgi:hypothetical protein
MAAEKVTTMTARRAKGAHPHFFDDANIDRLVSMMMNMAEEISVLRDRLDTHERLAAATGAYTPTDIEAYDPPDEVRVARDAWRAKFLDRLLKSLEYAYDRGPG